MPYFISDDYNARIGASQDFEGEIRHRDTHQNEVYETARQLADLHSYRKVFDFGAGGGFKLIKFFEGFDTVGLDLPSGVELLKAKYPNRTWLTADEAEGLTADIVICSDVIEHVDDPDWLCGFIKSLQPKHVVISTPDRDLVCERYDQPELGPPRNKTHVREWSLNEFGDYMAYHFQVEKLFYSNRRQFTMCITARPK